MKKENPPAFPSMDMNSYEGVDRLELKHEGMTLRDYFAGKAIASLLPVFGLSPAQVKEAATKSYEVADAMLAERSKEK